MVAYKTDPLGLNDTVNTSSSSSATNPNAATSHHHANNKRSFRHLANKLSVKKNRNKAATTTSSSGVTTTAAAASSSQSTPSLVAEPTIIFEDSKPPAAVRTTNRVAHTESPSQQRMENRENDATLLLAPNNGAQDHNKRIPKFIQKFTNCLPKPGDVTANEKVLITAFMTFFVFTVAQFVLAFAANSLSLLGDTAAQIIDCIDYCINFYAERRKHTFDQRYQAPPINTLMMTPARALQLRERAKRKAVLFWEVVPPMISVTCLVGVTAYVLEDSITTLIADFTTKPKSQQDDVNLTLVLTLQLVNLCIDVLDLSCFAKIHHLRGFDTMHHHGNKPLSSTPPMVNETIKPEDKEEVEDRTLFNVPHKDDDDVEGGETLKEEEVQPIVAPCSCCDHTKNIFDVSRFTTNVTAGEDESKTAEAGDVVSPSTDVGGDDENYRDGGDQANLNMCSAYTHVLADSMRTVSILGAVILAKAIKPITAEVADSAAAVVVSFIILMTLIPLIRGLTAAFLELRQIQAEEKAEMDHA